MSLNRAEIENPRAIQNRSLDFDNGVTTRQRTVLLGKNGSGNCQFGVNINNLTKAAIALQGGSSQLQRKEGQFLHRANTPLGNFER